MRWHAVDTNNDGMMRHPRDYEAWKQFDLTHTWFASYPRNLCLLLANDGFNPFGIMNSNYSIWPVIDKDHNGMMEDLFSAHFDVFLFICCNKSVRDQFWPKTLSLNL